MFIEFICECVFVFNFKSISRLVARRFDIFFFFSLSLSPLFHHQKSLGSLFYALNSLLTGFIFVSCLLVSVCVCYYYNNINLWYMYIIGFYIYWIKMRDS